MSLELAKEISLAKQQQQQLKSAEEASRLRDSAQASRRGSLDIALPPPPQLTLTEKVIYNILGTSPTREFWGLIPIDFGTRLGVTPHTGEGSHNYRVPQQRHQFNEPQYALHAEWSDLFLDLIFVGAGYRLGGLLKASFYRCGDYNVDEDFVDMKYGCVGGPTQGALESVGSSGSGSGSGKHARALAPGGGSGSGATYEECVGLPLGLLYFFALFQVLYRTWLTDMLHTSRYEAEDRYHRVLDVATYFLLCCAANSITSVDDVLTNGLAGFLGPICLVTGLWILRFIEMALVAPGEVTRRRSGADVIDHGQAVMLYGAAMWLLSPHAAGLGVDQSAGGWASVLAPVLMIVGGLWYEIRLLYRLSRPYFCLSTTASAVMLEAWPVKRMVVPHNIGFVIHRFNEFMMLMLGETLLQLVIANVSYGDSNLTYYGLSFGGFVICVAMMFSYHISEPHHAYEHVLGRAGQAPPGSAARRRWTVAGILYMGILMSFKSACVLLTGVGIKLAAYAPNLPPDERASAATRLQLALALVFCFGMNAVLRPLHSSEGIVYYYARICTPGHYERAAVAAGRLLLCAAHLTVAFLPLVPLWSVLLQAALSVLQCALILRDVHTAHRETHGDSATSPHHLGRRSSGGGRMTLGVEDHRLLANSNILFDSMGGLPVDAEAYVLRGTATRSTASHASSVSSASMRRTDASARSTGGAGARASRKASTEEKQRALLDRARATKLHTQHNQAAANAQAAADSSASSVVANDDPAAMDGWGVRPHSPASPVDGADAIQQHGGGGCGSPRETRDTARGSRVTFSPAVQMVPPADQPPVGNAPAAEAEAQQNQQDPPARTIAPPTPDDLYGGPLAA